jgi:hypothetical protein
LGSKAKWGLISTSNGSFPGHAGYQAGNSTQGSSGNQWHVGFLCQDSIDGCFVAGNLVTSGAVLRGTYGFRANEIAVAVNNGSSNQSSLSYHFVDNYGTGAAAAESHADITLKPTSGPNPIHRLAFSFGVPPTTEQAAISQTGSYLTADNCLLGGLVEPAHRLHAVPRQPAE